MLTSAAKAYIIATEALLAFKCNQRGVTAIEYGLIAIVLATLLIFVFMREGNFISVLQSRFDDLAESGHFL